MKTQIVYVVVSSEGDLFLEELWVSVYSLRQYHPEVSVTVIADKATAKFVVPAGHFAVFFPEDAHQPGIAPGKEYRKLIVKARVNQ